MPENLEVDEKVTTFAHVNETSRDGAEVARWAHNPKVVGSNPAPATKRGSPFGGSLIFYMLGIGMCADSSVVAYPYTHRGVLLQQKRRRQMLIIDLPPRISIP